MSSVCSPICELAVFIKYIHVGSRRPPQIIAVMGVRSLLLIGCGLPCGW